MSFVLQSNGQPEAPKSTALTTTSQTDVFTADSQYAQRIDQIWVANEDSSNDILVTLEWNDGSTDYTFFIGTIPSQTTVFLDPGFLLSSKSATQKLKATAGTANQITVTVISIAHQSQQGRIQ